VQSRQLDGQGLVMEKMLSNGNTAVSAQDANLQACLEQAEICCEQARLAAHRRRYEAACGLFSTAIALYQQAIAMNSAPHAIVAEQLRHIEIERSAYSELARSMARPLLTRQSSDRTQSSGGSEH
jgi:hypothetical protein